MSTAVDPADGADMASPAGSDRVSSRESLLEWVWGLVRLDFVGIAVGSLFFCLSLTPSLLPRDWLFAGLIGGINASIGYGIGILIKKVIRRVVLAGRSWWPPRRRVLRGIKALTVGSSAAVCVLVIVPAAAWQRQVSALMGIEGPGTLGYFRTLLIAAAVSALVIGAARILRDAIRLLARVLIRRWRINDEVALFVGTIIVVVLLVTLINGVLPRGFVVAGNRMFQPQNSTTAPGAEQPTEPERSGSPESFAPWDTLGYQGRSFVAGGPDAAQLEQINGVPAKEPIRVYAGLQTADTEAGRMAVVLSELQRTGAFDRKVLVVIPTTGTGWVTPEAARSIETMYNGDTALVAVQYSYLPSWVSFLADRQKSMRSGRLLIDTVHERWAQLPPEHRPRLLIYGESLGAMAGQAAFGFLPDVSRMGFDGVLWVGPPNASPLWRALIARRDPGSTEVDPRYDNGRTVRFSQAIEPADVVRATAAPWDGTRVLFLQHPSDPIVWWSPDLLFARPDWLTEPPGADRTASMRWYPIITFWQVSADLTNAVGMPPGHGHNYANTELDGWVAVAAPEGWTAADTERVRRSMEKYGANDGPPE